VLRAACVRCQPPRLPWLQRTGRSAARPEGAGRTACAPRCRRRAGGHAGPRRTAGAARCIRARPAPRSNMLGHPCMSKCSMTMKLPLPRNVPPGTAQQGAEHQAAGPQADDDCCCLWGKGQTGCWADRRRAAPAAHSGRPWVPARSLCLRQCNSEIAEENIWCRCIQHLEASRGRTIHRLQAQRLAFEHRVVSGGAELYKHFHTVVQLIPAQRCKLQCSLTCTRNSMSHIGISVSCGCWRGCTGAVGSNTL